MDKFGIFKLLNSFYNFYENNKNSFPPTDKENNTASPLSFLVPKPVRSEPEKEKRPSPTPLQINMLSTINSHDAIVRRVQKNCKNKSDLPLK